MTIFEKTSGGLVAQSERTVTTFPSGLVRVDRRYACSNDFADVHRLSLTVGSAMPDDDGEPSIDGLKIYPEPQETKDHAFTYFAVSAYGRTQSTLSRVELAPVSVLGTGRVGEGESTTFIPLWVYLWAISGQLVETVGVLPSIDDLGISPALLEPIRFSLTESGAALPFIKSGNSYVVTAGAVEAVATLSGPFIAFDNYRNFGDIAEIDITVTQGLPQTNLSEPEEEE